MSDVTLVLPGKAIEVLVETGWFARRSARSVERLDAYNDASHRTVGRGYQISMTVSRVEAEALADHFRRVLVETPSTRRVWHVAARRSIAVITQALQ